LNILELIGRDEELFTSDMEKLEKEIKNMVSSSRFLVIGGAGSIGQAVTKEIFKRDPVKLHVVDISENNLAELVRDLRSSIGYINGEFKTFAIDAGSLEFDAFLNSSGDYDFILNLSALKHVRSEKDPFTLMRMINVNILNTEKTLIQARKKGAKKYFCVSTDKATNPVNMMGASKRIMELFLMRRSLEIPVSTARFANVAFSDGSLLYSFNMRLEKKQPIVAPCDVKRYFVTAKESGELCLLSALFGDNRDIYFPKLSEKLHLITFSEIALRYLKIKGYEPYICESEEEAREFFKSKSKTLNPKSRYWPCFFTVSDTTGEKDFEEFYTDNDIIDLKKFDGIGVIKNQAKFNNEKLEYFSKEIENMKKRGTWTKNELVELFKYMLPEFRHMETGKYLDEKM
jgi:FlaA1/EpsC-like NDP-sugar epimerase